ncbi:beta-galactosidase, partial [Patescibacteria group bacterium]|nr:beta-galactosidase [Patescibacteria group bacterium]
MKWFKRILIVYAVLISVSAFAVFLNRYLTGSRASSTNPVTVVWNKELPSVGQTALPSLAYDPTRKQLLVVWQDSRSDPQNNPDGYGPQYNDNIYGRLIDAGTGTLIGDEIAIADRGQYQSLTPARYDNESYAAVVYDNNQDKYLLSWMTISDATLKDASTDSGSPWNQSSCTDVAFRTYDPATHGLSASLLDVAGIPVSGPDYAGSCQQESSVLPLNNGRALVVWHDSRSRYTKINGYDAGKDIYGRQVDINNPAAPVGDTGGSLYSRQSDGTRVAHNQEFPRYAAKGVDRYLVVWSDNRPGATGVWGQFVGLDGTAIGNNIHILNSTANCTYDLDCPKQPDYLYRPTVAYRSGQDVFIVVASKKLNATNDTNTLVMSTVSRQTGAVVQADVAVPDSQAGLYSFPSVACSGSTCLLMYRKNNRIMIKTQNQTGNFEGDMALDDLSGPYQDYPRLIAVDNGIFYGVYDTNNNDGRGSRVRVVKLDTSVRSSSSLSSSSRSSSSSSQSSASSSSASSVIPRSTSTHGSGIGECHTLANVSNANVQWTYPSSELFWSRLEPQEGKYDFSSVDQQIAAARAQHKKIWLQVLVSNPDSPSQYPSVPQWAIDKGMRVYNQGVPVQWDPQYLAYHEKILQALAQRYEKPEYADVIEAVLIQGGGNYGEMYLGPKYCYGDSNIPSGAVADVLDPNNFWVKEMARTVLGSPDRSGEIAKINNSQLVFDNDYIQAVKNIVDIYGRSFHTYPFVIQVGTGLSCQARVQEEVARYGVDKYGYRFWLKANFWGSFTGLGTGDANVIDPFFSQYRGRTVITYEVGHPSFFCAAGDGYQTGGCADCCRWNTHEEAVRHNANAINLAINSGATAICFQSDFFNQPSKYPVDMNQLQARLVANANALPVITSSSSSSVSSRSSSSSSVSTNCGCDTALNCGTGC